jgi:hypothetical protein
LKAPAVFFERAWSRLFDRADWALAAMVVPFECRQEVASQIIREENLESKGFFSNRLFFMVPRRHGARRLLVFLLTTLNLLVLLTAARLMHQMPA